MRLVLAAAAFSIAAAPVWAATTIRCSARGQAPVVIALDSRLFEGRSMSCLSGSFAVDLTPCAPDGGFSMSAPMGSASIMGLAATPQGYADHDGGVVGFERSAEGLAFTGGLYSADTGMSGEWAFRLDLKSGVGTLTRNGLHDVSFTCRRPAPGR